jgi:predicted flap endonuclease-1-like 5' DNA nuclease
MSLLYRIIYAAHAKGTHHKLALDGLAFIGGRHEEEWRRLFLKHAEPFMVGAKAPDDVFKDFKNHCLHPRDKFWGGAPATARLWYGKTVAALQEGNWPEAAYAAGVLSHYVTDAVHPFHTGQSEAENSIHRAFEWSTAKSYDALKAIAHGVERHDIEVPQRPDWLEEMLRIGATRSNRHYEKVIAHYDIHRGVVDPPAGLDNVAQRIVGDLILYASRLFGTILDCALTESKVQPPDVSLTVDLVLATLKIPVKMLAKRLADNADRKLVEAMYDELKETGTVEQTLPPDDRLVRDTHRAEVLGTATAPKPITAETASPPPRSATMPSLSFGPPPPHGGPMHSAASKGMLAARPVDPASEMPIAPAHTPSLSSRLASATPEGPRPSGSPEPARQVVAKPVADAVSRPADNVEPLRPAAGASVPSIRPQRPAVSSLPKVRLTPSDDIVDAPSIGPRMAERLHPLGILTVKDLLDEDAAALAGALRAPGVSTETIADWQAQALMVCTVPGLSGTGAQLFVGAGYRDAAAIAEADTDKICSELLTFAGTEKGRRILRDGDPPNVERIKGWTEYARMAIAA